MTEGDISGTIDGLPTGVTKFESGGTTLKLPAGVTNFVIGSPINLVTAQTGSDISFDVTKGIYYMALAQGGSTWVRLGSIADQES